MPNYCANVLKFRHPDPAMNEKLIAAFKENKMLESIIPIPAELLDTVKGYLGDGEEQAANEQKVADNMAKYGYPTWYEFCISEWGTKWDVGGTDAQISQEEYYTVLTFNSAWSPPVYAYDEMVEQGYDVLAYYYEPGCCFAGEYNNGNDDCYDDATYDMLPESIIEIFGIEEYEEEED